MKRLLFVAIPIIVIASFAAGWHGGERSMAAVASSLLRDQEFNKAYTIISENNAVTALLDTGKIEDAKYLLYLRECGAIFALEDSLATNSDMWPSDLKYLKNLNDAIQKGSPRETADKILARVAARRTQFPENYQGPLLQPIKPETEAKVETILKRAAESQKNIYTNANFK